MDEHTLARFWAKVDIPADRNGCWLWTAVVSTHGGYGQFFLDHKRVRAHRLSYVIAYGEIPRSMVVCHRCDNPRCVNPDHLFIGTQADNMRDMKNKGRAVRGGPVRVKERRPLRPARKLTPDSVRAIRERRASGEPIYRLAMEYGVSRSSVHMAVSKKAWRDVA